jgi:hypothetical protein
MEKNILLTSINGKDAFKKGKDGYCYTFNKNKESRLKAYNNACKSKIRHEQSCT